MSEFSDMAKAFDRDQQRASAQEDYENVFAVTQAAATRGLPDLRTWRANRDGLIPNARPFVEPRQDQGLE